MTDLNRRDFLSTGAAAAGGAALALGAFGAGNAHADMHGAMHEEMHGGMTHSRDMLRALFPGAVNEEGEYTLPELKYAYSDVDEVIDEQTMMLHHSRHHQGYVNGLKNAEAKLAEARETGDFSLIQHWSRQASFHGGGHFLHSVFWDCIGGPEEMGGEPEGALMEAIERDFGGFDQMMAHFAAASKAVEGSGWGILGYSLAAAKLVILQGQNQQLLTQWGVVPILCNDVWEHAYYLRYQNNRGAYVDAFPRVINWTRVAKRFSLLA